MTNLLPLDTFRAKLGLHPYHFWGLAGTQIVPVVAKCSGLTLEYSWQGSDAAGRADVRAAIERAEQKLMAYVGHAPAPRYVETLPIAWPRYFQQPLVRLRDRDGDGLRVAVQAPDGYVLRLGVEQLTAIGTATVGGGTLVYSDQFTSGMDDTFTITLPYAGSDPSEVAVYFAAADCPDGGGLSERWRVRPVHIAITGGNVVITGRRWLCVRPILYEAPGGAAIDPTNSANFATSLRVYQRTTNGDGNSVDTCQSTLIYETTDCGGWGRNYCGCSAAATTDPGTVGEVIARGAVRDKRAGQVYAAAAVYNVTTGTWSDASCASCYAEPDRVVLRYLAGYPANAQGEMDDSWAEIVTYLAAAELKTRIAACRDVNERLFELQQDLTLESTQTERYQVSPRDLDNPFGTRRGHVLAWRAAKLRLLTRGMTA